MKRTFIAIAATPLWITAGALAADMPKEGRYEYQACWSGTSNLIAFSKTHTALSYEMMGAVRAVQPGSLFDKNTFR
jgi:hypothetical protein